MTLYYHRKQILSEEMSAGLVAVVVLLLAVEASCFPGGAPLGACDTLAPNQAQHLNAAPQTSAVPYELYNFTEAFYVNDTLAYEPGATYRCKRLAS